MRLDPSVPRHRTPLTHGAWVDLHPGRLRGADELFHRLATTDGTGSYAEYVAVAADSATLARAVTLVSAVETVLPLSQAARAHESVEA